MVEGLKECLYNLNELRYFCVIFLSLAALLTACANHGGGFGSLLKGFTMGPGVPEELTCENTSFHEHYCATGEHPNLCDC